MHKWYFSKESQIRGVCLLVHGLNIQPEKMMSFGHELNNWGYHVLLVCLKGHGNDYQEFKNISHDDWLNDLKEAYIEAQSLAKKNYLKIFYLGYSLGAILGLIFSSLSEKGNLFTKQILLAPPLKLRWYFDFLKPFAKIPKISYRSFNLLEFRAHKYTPSKAYNSLLKLIESIDYLNIENTPTLIVYPKKDEFSAIDDIDLFIKKRELSEWQLHILPPVDHKLPQHLILDSQTFGEPNWKHLVNLMKDHLK